MTTEKLSALLRSIGIALFQSASYNAKWDAQRNLQGRTHYVDDDTLRGFRAKIMDSGAAHDGLTFWLVESVGNKPSDTPGGYFRFVAFDIFGSVTTERDVWFKSTRAALKAGKAWIAQWDAIAHTTAHLSTRASCLRKEADKITEALAN